MGLGRVPLLLVSVTVHLQLALRRHLCQAANFVRDQVVQQVLSCLSDHGYAPSTC